MIRGKGLEEIQRLEMTICLVLLMSLLAACSKGSDANSNTPAAANNQGGEQTEKEVKFTFFIS